MKLFGLTSQSNVATNPVLPHPLRNDDTAAFLITVVRPSLPYSFTRALTIVIRVPLMSFI